MRSSVTIDISPARFKSQMICSNQNKSHLVIFSAHFVMLGFCILQQWKKKTVKGDWLLSFNGPIHFGNHRARFAPTAPVSAFPYGRTRWKASFYNFQVAHKPPTPLLLRITYICQRLSWMIEWASDRSKKRGTYCIHIYLLAFSRQEDVSILMKLFNPYLKFHNKIQDGFLQDNLWLKMSTYLCLS